MDNPLRRRQQKVYELLKKHRLPSALLLSSAEPSIRSRDTHHHFRQNSNFYYLTGSTGQGLALLVSSEAKQPVLFAPKISRERILWEGPGENVNHLAKLLGAELVVSPNPRKEILTRLRGTHRLYYDNTAGLTFEITRSLMGLSSHERGSSPIQFIHCDMLLEPLRLFKDRSEIKLMRQAARITYRSISETLALIQPGKREQDLQASIDYWFMTQGGYPSFQTIVATGKSAAVLHHRPGPRVLKSSELLLIDCGAEYNMYAADVSRTFPVQGKFQEPYRTLYQAVLDAQKAAISKIKDGVLVKKVYNAAAEVMTESLVELGVLRGRVSTLMKREAYKPFFPHSIGHTLGLDVHDVGGLRGNKDATLKKGMVFTVEPGLYFSKGVGKLPACGVRIEDDVLVTKKGHEILSGEIPKEIVAVEEWMAGG